MEPRWRYERFPALRRRNVVKGLGRLTSTEGANHLLTFAEFAPSTSSPGPACGDHRPAREPFMAMSGDER